MEKRIFKTIALTVAVISTAFLTSCSDYEDREVITNTYSGNIDVTSGGVDPAGDFTGSGDSGTYSFAWINPQQKASANFDITSNTGSVQMIVKDNAGTVVIDKTLTAGGNDSYSGVSDAGEEGTWIVEMILTDFNGDGSYSLHPGN
jgi:hypothetical protein